MNCNFFQPVRCDLRTRFRCVYPALDKKSGRDVVEIMQKLAKEQGCTILLVTHDNRILDIADRIVYMEDGRLAENPNAASKVK